MPTLFTVFGIRFYFYLDEHLPIHVHVDCGGKKAKIECALYRMDFISEWHKRFG